MYWAYRDCISSYWDMYSFSVWYNLHCKTGKGGKIVLIETTVYNGTWVRVDDQIKKWTDIKNKFEKGA